MPTEFLGGSFIWSGVLVTGGWGLAGLLLAIRFFRREARTD
jgi:hypothetical protein